MLTNNMEWGISEKVLSYCHISTIFKKNTNDIDSTIYRSYMKECLICFKYLFNMMNKDSNNVEI